MALVSTQIAQNRSTPFLCAMFMPGNSKECRRHAARCAEMAVAARTPALKATFLVLSQELGETLQFNWKVLSRNLPKVRILTSESPHELRRDAAELFYFVPTFAAEPTGSLKCA